MKILQILLFFIAIPVFPQAGIEEIDKLIDAGELQKAKNILQNNPHKSKVHLEYLGDIAGYEEDWEKAVFYYKKLVELEPANADYNFKYGGALGLKALSVSKFQALVYISDIKNHLEKAASLDKGHTKARQALVELYMNLPGIIGGSEQKSRNFATELAAIDPVKGALAMAYIHNKTGEKQKANNDYKEALALFYNRKSDAGSDRGLKFQLGKISAEYQIYPTVGLRLLDDFIKNYSIRDREALEWAYLYKAQIHAGLNEKQEALKSIEKALTLRDNFGEARMEKERILSLK